MNSFQTNQLLRGCPSTLILEIGREIERVDCSDGTLLFDEGDTGGELYLVGEGRVRISKLGRGGQQETLGYIEAGNYFGEMAVLDGKPRSARAAAVGQCVLGKISAEGFLRVIRQAPPEFFMQFLREVTQRLRDVNSHFISELLRNERLSLVGTMASSIIHDFKNPMNVILMATELLERSASSEKSRDYTGMIKKSLQRMLGMTQELLDFSRGNSDLNLECCTVSALMEELQIEALAALPAIIQVRQNLLFDGPVNLDRNRFVRVLANLVKNAGEAMTRQGGIIELAVESREGRVIFTVADNGPGIPPEILSRVFEPFVTHGKSHGTGLGMAIVKSVVEAHKGTVAVESALGQGTRVTIELPLL
jgi:signal transduction histidine kinase